MQRNPSISSALLARRAREQLRTKRVPVLLQTIRFVPPATTILHTNRRDRNAFATMAMVMSYPVVFNVKLASTQTIQ